VLAQKLNGTEEAGEGMEDERKTVEAIVVRSSIPHVAMFDYIDVCG
jgi:hypothetical protein